MKTQSTGRRATTANKNKSLSQDTSVLSLLDDWQIICEEEGVVNPPAVRRKDSIRSPSEEEVPKTEILFGAEDTKGSFKDLEVIGPLIGTEVGSAFGKLLLACSSLKVVKLVNCDLRAEHIILLEHFVSQHATITDLYLDSNPKVRNFGPIASCTMLEVLSLRMCALTCEDIKPIASELSNPDATLVILNLNINLIADEGVKLLANALKMNKNLRALCLAGNKIRNSGAEYLFKSFTKYTLTDADLEVYKAWQAKRNDLIVDTVAQRYREMTTDYYKRITGKELSTSNRFLRKRAKGSEKQKKGSALNIRDKQEQDVQGANEGDNRDISEEGEERLSCMISGTDTITDFTDFADILQSTGDTRDMRREDDIYNAMAMVDELMTTDMGIGPCPLGIVRDNERPTAKGNMTLIYLNVAYNEFTDNTLQHLITSIRYQRDQLKMTGLPGLKTVLLKGNKMPAGSEAKAKVGTLLNMVGSDSLVS